MRNIDLRRVAAFGIDWLILWLYAGSVIAIMFAAHGADGLIEYEQNLSPWAAEALSFFVMTLPFVLYFAILESRASAATVGKRLLGLQVLPCDGTRMTFGPALLRATAKFLPWELGHVFANNLRCLSSDADLPLWSWLLFALSMGGSLAYFVSLFIRSGATPYDLLSGTRVVYGVSTKS